jgi:hypothetical protein
MISVVGQSTFLRVDHRIGHVVAVGGQWRGEGAMTCWAHIREEVELTVLYRAVLYLCDVFRKLR